MAVPPCTNFRGSRLLELTDIPPDYLKLDMGLIQGIDEAKSRREIVRALLQVVGAQGVQIIAEGIEGDSTAATCRGRCRSG